MFSSPFPDSTEAERELRIIYRTSLRGRRDPDTDAGYHRIFLLYQDVA